ncbi:type III-A CRISPR-associated protein Cas10/Csm1, partial [candidate division KSB1 bacterium]|nr:type III-A CRISPR-associated protein Cas10/Csm1 [candidate division KSB1 bacterium]
MIDRTRQNIILGALLHDIGKFWQRSEKEVSYEKSQNLKHTTTNIIGDFCPKRDGVHYSHKHSAWTYQFLSDFENVLFKSGTKGEDIPIHLAANHHNPGTTLQEIIQIADWISSAMDRSKETEDEKDEVTKKYAFRKRRLRPVFESIFRDEYGGKRNKFYNINEMELSESVFPKVFESQNRDLYSEYDQLWQGFEEEFRKLPNGSFSVYLESLLSLLKKYTWCIPSSTGDNPDISIYDHLKTTAAISICLYDYFNETNPEWIKPDNKSNVGKVKNWYRENNESFARLICGDLSGIQKFIYQISEKKAAVSLKGRSFALQLLSNVSARYILNQLELPFTNLIYSSGGNFYIIAPNTKNTNEQLLIIQNKLNRSLLSEYDGTLYLGIGSVGITTNDLMNVLNERWIEVIESANRDKRKRFKKMFLEDYFFQPYGACADVEQCKACGKDVEKEDLKLIDENLIVCKSCNKFIKIGNRLKRIEWLVEYHGEEEIENVFRPLPDIPIGYLMADSPQDSEKIAKGDFVKINRISSTDFLPKKKSLRYPDRAYGFSFYGGNSMPVDDNGVSLTFNDLAGKSGYKRLGVLRMDVDNLGTILQRGLIYPTFTSEKQIEDKTNRYSISRLSTLSSMLDLFFCGYLNTIYEESFKNEAFTIYSGGDDLFLVGKWDQMVEFAKRIYGDFREFTCQNPKITLSGGIVLTREKYPIHRSAEMAGSAEEQAKSLPDKDGISFLGKAVKWSDFEQLNKMKDEIIDITKITNSNAIIDRLRRIYATYWEERQRLLELKIDEKAREEMIAFNKWRWRMVYSMTRLAKKESRAKYQLEELQKQLMGKLPSG